MSIILFHSISLFSYLSQYSYILCSHTSQIANSLSTSLTLSKGPTATCIKDWHRIHNKVQTKELLEHLLHFYVVHELLAWATIVPYSCTHSSLHLLWLQLPVAACLSLGVLLRIMKQRGPVSTGAHLHKQK